MIELLGRENVKVSSEHMSEILNLLRKEEMAKQQEEIELGEGISDTQQDQELAEEQLKQK